MTDLLKYALRYAANGFPVLPLHTPTDDGCSCSAGAECGSPGKHPRLKRGTKDASTDHERIREWWSRWPDANVGITLPEGVFALDVDGELGIETLEELGDVPETATQITSRGRHYLLLAPIDVEVRNWCSKIGETDTPNIDIRTSGGLLVVAPSIHHTGHLYEWDVPPKRENIAPAPQWFVELARTARPIQVDHGQRADTDQMTSHRQSRYWATVLSSELAELRAAVPNGKHGKGRGDTLFRVAATLYEHCRGGTGNESQAEAEMTAVALDLGLAQRRINKTLRSARKKAYGPQGRARRPKERELNRKSSSSTSKKQTKSRPSPSSPKAKKAKKKIPKVVVYHPSTEIPFAWGFGPSVYFDSGERVEVYGRDVAPIGVATDEGAPDEYVVLRYRRVSGAYAETVVPAGATVAKSVATRAAEELRTHGVQIIPGRGADFVMALGQWLHYAKPSTFPIVLRTGRPGWRVFDGQWIYVNGDVTHGSTELDWQYDGETERSQRAGTVDAWTQNMMRLATTPALRFALAVSLAGALLRRLRLPSFAVNYVGASTTGKSSASILALSLWSSPEAKHSWNSTRVAIEHLCVGYSDACLVLDELALTSSRMLTRSAHMIADGKSRARSVRTGTKRVQDKTWNLSVLTSGEASAADIAEGEWQGGHSVRFIDCPVERGDATESAAHAEEIKDACWQTHGAAGDAWVEHLVELDAEGWRELSRKVLHYKQTLVRDPDPELRRILGPIATCLVALEEACRIGLLRFQSSDCLMSIYWAIDSIRQARHGKSTPFERAWFELQSQLLTNPTRFPSESAYKNGNQADVVGIVVNNVGTVTDGGSTNIYTSESMLSRSGIPRGAGASVRHWIDWMIEEGLAERDDRARRIAGRQRRWISIPIDAQLKLDRTDRAT